MRLKKTTIANMGNNAMNKVVGGDTSVGVMCPTWGNNSCITLCYSFDPPAFCQDPSFCDCGTFNC